MALPRIHSPNFILPLLELEEFPPTIKLAFDVARFGPDNNVLWIRFGQWVIDGGWWKGLDTFENAALLSRIVEEYEDLGWIAEWIQVDVIGPGAGVVDELWHRSERLKYLVKPINVSLTSTEPTRFRRVRSELAWKLRRRFRNRDIFFLSRDRFPSLAAEQVVHPSMIDRLKKQATTLQYKADEHVGGTVVVESKKEFKKRMEGSESPDEFDACALLFNDDLAGLEQRPKMRSGGISLTAR